VRGAGLMIGIEFGSGAEALGLVRALLERGYIVLPASADARVISLTPPLTIEPARLDGFVAALDAALRERTP
jgi:4-aminobutyrate aminotransferase-like enzyme